MRGIRIALLCSTLILAACGSYGEKARDIAKTSSMQWGYISAGAFDLAASWKSNRNGDVLTVYIEGDGMAYLSPSEPSSDPTPSDPVALKLATQHPGRGAVAYLARPCQYGVKSSKRNCRDDYWTEARFAPEAVDSVNRAIDVLKTKTGSTRTVLVGYSGGGAIAVLVAARRNDIDEIITVAGNIDTEKWTEGEDLSPLEGSLNPAKSAPSVAHIPQVHFSGAEDEAVSTEVARSFIGKLPNKGIARLVVVPGFDHNCCWADQWSSLLKKHAPEVFKK